MDKIEELIQEINQERFKYNETIDSLREQLNKKAEDILVLKRELQDVTNERNNLDKRFNKLREAISGVKDE